MKIFCQNISNSKLIIKKGTTEEKFKVPYILSKICLGAWCPLSSYLLPPTWGGGSYYSKINIMQVFG